MWGGFYAAPDGNFYVVTGQKNLDENDRLTVVRVLKYDRTWKLLGATDISGDYTNMFKGIYIPFGRCFSAHDSDRIHTDRPHRT